MFKSEQMQKFIINAKISFEDIRMKIMGLTIITAIILTMLTYYTGLWNDSSKFSGSIFASWISNLLFFSLIGIVATIISLRKPEAESFDTRARILFRTQKGGHIDFIINKLQFLDHYNVSTEKNIIIQEYNEPKKMYYINSITRSVVKSFIDDIFSTYKANIKVFEVTKAPENGQKNKLEYLKIGDAPLFIDVSFDEEFNHEITETLNPGESRDIEHKLNSWVSADTEHNTHTTVRYTRSIAVKIENRTAVEVKIRYTTCKSPIPETASIRSGQTLTIVNYSDIPPDTEVCDYVIIGH